MAGNQVSTGVTIINSMKGFAGISLTNFNNQSEPAIASGSIVEIASAFFSFSADESVTGFSAIATGATVFVALTPAGTAGSQTVTASWAVTTPEWSDDKQGWYASSGSTIRYVAGCVKLSDSVYDQKFVLRDKQDVRPLRKAPHSVYGQLGSGIAVTTTTFPAACALDETTFAVSDDSTVVVLSWDGYEFSTVGSALSHTCHKDGLCALSSTSIALMDSSDNLYKFIWDGSSFATAGSPLNVGGNSIHPIRALDDSTIVSSDRQAQEIRAYAFDGSNWATSGTPLTITGVSANPSLASLTPFSVVRTSVVSESMQRYDWDGSNWSTAGTAFSIGTSQPTAIASLNSTDVVIRNEAQKTFRLLRYSSEDEEWIEISSVEAPSTLTAIMSKHTASSFLYLSGGAEKLRIFSINMVEV